jgi:hypothetical protein
VERFLSHPEVKELLKIWTYKNKYPGSNQWWGLLMNQIKESTGY